MALALAVVAGVVVRGERARACGGGEWPTIGTRTTFDPYVLGDDIDDGLFYEPTVEGWAGSCGGCAANPVLDDWTDYLDDAVESEDWEKILYKAPAAELVALERKLAGKVSAVPSGYEQSSLWRSPAAAPKLARAIAFVELARDVERTASLDATSAPAGSVPPMDLLARARAGMAIADPFLAQRYAFQAIRVLFYTRDFRGAIAFVHQNTAALSAPSEDLAWNARYYAAGALVRTGDRARADLEFARIHAGYPPLAARALRDFHPDEDKDWRASLKLAKTVREQTELWRLVGVQHDGIVAMQEIIKLDPRSDLIALLLVRELARAEALSTPLDSDKPVPAAIAAQQKAYATLETLATDLLAKGGDRPWLLELVAAHIEAKRGELDAVRTRVARVITARPLDDRVVGQAKATLALALAASWTFDPAQEHELMKALAVLDEDYGRTDTVTHEVREQLAAAYGQAGREAEAEFLSPDPPPVSERMANRRRVTHWEDPAFLKAMIERVGQTSSRFDRFLVSDTYTKEGLERELALRDLGTGEYDRAAQAMAGLPHADQSMGTDPFVMHIVDCHDCDHEKYQSSSWTLVKLAKRMAELERAGNGKGETAARAALAMGSALYNLSYYGNARAVFEDSHQPMPNPADALRWFQRAYELTRNRDLKVHAAYYAAKAELAFGYGAVDGGDDSDVTWFAEVKRYRDTAYYKQVLRECGYFARYLKQR